MNTPRNHRCRYLFSTHETQDGGVGCNEPMGGLDVGHGPNEPQVMDYGEMMNLQPVAQESRRDLLPTQYCFYVSSSAGQCIRSVSWRL